MPIHRHTRLERRGDILERLLDAELGPWLDQNGFAERHPFSFRRRWESGDDAVFVNIEPRWFSVNVATAPDGMAEIYDLYDADGSFRGHIERGIVCASVLTPAGVFGTDRSDCTFKTRRAAIRDKSIRRARQAFDGHLAAWFRTVHDPRGFVTAIQPSATLLLARAHELAGDLAEAGRLYREKLAMSAILIEHAGGLREFASHVAGAREFTYLCRKLNTQTDMGQEVEAMISYLPQVTPLGAAPPSGRT